MRKKVALAFYVLACVGIEGASSATSICEALAVPLKLKPPAPPEKPNWRRDMLGSFGNFMFGGTSVVSMGVVPPEPRTVESIDRALASCTQSDKGASCVVEWPNSLKMSIKTEDILITPDKGESGEVTIKGSVIECRDNNPSG